MAKSNKYIRAILNRRKQYIELTLDQKQEIINIYTAAGQEIKSRLTKAKKGSLNERYLKEMDKSISEYIEQLNIELDKSIRRYMQKAADLGVDEPSSYFEDMKIPMEVKQTFKSMFTNISDSTVKLLVSGGYYKDGKTLSSRIWNISKGSGKEIETIINIAIAEQKSTNELAKDLEKYIIDGVGTRQKTKIPGISSDICYEAVRLARTSIAHSYIESSVQGGMNNPYCLGLKWNRSSEHSARLARFGKTRDICDDYAEDDKYDLGAGVYPPKYYPIGHPNCLCYSTNVLVDIEIAESEIIDWINGSTNKKLDAWARRNGFTI